MIGVRINFKAIVLTVLLCVFLPLVEVAAQKPDQAVAAKRAVAVTFDDLPLQGPRLETSKLRAMTEKLLKSLAKHKIPPFGVVTGYKLYRNERLDPAQVAILRMWLDAGGELGNHTHSHADINLISLAAYQADVIRGEQVISDLLREKGMKLRYFRHPVLHTGRDEQTRIALHQFLTTADIRSLRLRSITRTSSLPIFTRGPSDATIQR